MKDMINYLKWSVGIPFVLWCVITVVYLFFSFTEMEIVPKKNIISVDEFTKIEFNSNTSDFKIKWAAEPKSSVEILKKSDESIKIKGKEDGEVTITAQVSWGGFFYTERSAVIRVKKKTCYNCNCGFE